MSKSQFGAVLMLVPTLVVGAVVSRLMHDRVGGRLLRVFVLIFPIVSDAVLLVRA